ncbi:hypothetical protein [Acidovorax lacteus]|uniref:AI-2E family transporter n=1 Tax=Acidovorax lacteus TaxID=1924988 RepID=A0ABP8LD34_9BURK
MKSDANNIQDARARWVTVVLLALSLAAVGWALVIQAFVAAAALSVVAILFAVLLFLLPKSWNRIVVDVLSNFGW